MELCASNPAVSTRTGRRRSGRASWATRTLRERRSESVIRLPDGAARGRRLRSGPLRVSPSAGPQPPCCPRRCRRRGQDARRPRSVGEWRRSIRIGALRATVAGGTFRLNRDRHPPGADRSGHTPCVRVRGSHRPAANQFEPSRTLSNPLEPSSHPIEPSRVASRVISSGSSGSTVR